MIELLASIHWWSFIAGAVVGALPAYVAGDCWREAARWERFEGDEP